MKGKILTILLVISVLLNIIGAFTLGYHISRMRKVVPLFSTKGYAQRFMHMRNLAGEDEIETIRALRDSLLSEREKLLILFQKQTPDTVELENTFSRMSKLRNRIERECFDVMKNRLCSIPPERRMKILERLEKNRGRKPLKGIERRKK